LKEIAPVRLLELARWTLERWARRQTWHEGGPGLAAEEDRPVDGLFVTLKVAGALRGCIGTVERHDSLDALLRRMTVCAAAEDPRFPPVEVNELQGILIELSLLTTPERIAGPEAIVLGRDGLIIELNESRGLFLPEVPLEWNWDRERYLVELCRKASLPPESWKDPRAKLYRFESRKFSEKAD